MTLAVGVCAIPAHALDVEGAVQDDSGNPLPGVPVCLANASDAETCAAIRRTDRSGRYRFRGLEDAGSYVLTIHHARTPATRQEARYRTYTWQPETRTVQPTMQLDRRKSSKKSVLRLAPFVGSFNFSNFQRAVELTAADFPELADLDTSAEPTFLKVSYVADSAAEQPPETVFLGRLHEADSFRLQASLPLSVTSIDYELFSETIAIQGRIDLEAP